MDTASTVGRSEIRRHNQKGYVLLTLLLFMALLVIASAAAAPRLAFEIRRDREQELIHRGVQYSRAIRNFAKATGRYPVTLDQLRETGGVRFIRKLYKDPITGGDFRLLHQGDVITPTTAPATGTASTQQQNGAPGGATTSTGQADANTAQPDAAKTEANSIGSSNDSINQVGQVIFGVASKSKGRTIREFDRKNHYNDWLFFYDPTRDQGREIKGPTSQSQIPDENAGSVAK